MQITIYAWSNALFFYISTIIEQLPTPYVMQAGSLLKFPIFWLTHPLHQSILIFFFSHHELLINLFLHPADFRAVSMTHSGTVVFPNEYSTTPYTVINQDHLNRGRVAVMTFKPIGEIGEYADLLPWNFAQIIQYRYGLGWAFSELFDYENGRAFAAPYENEP